MKYLRKLWRFLRAILPWVFAVLASVRLFELTELCNLNEQRPEMARVDMVMNIAIIFCVFLFIYILTDRWWISLGCSGVLLTVLSIVNVYSIEFRNTPISAKDLYNARSAMNVLGSYTIAMNDEVRTAIWTGVGMAALAFVCFWLEWRRKHYWKRWGIQLAAGCIILIAFFRIFCFGLHPVNIGALDYEQAYKDYGFMQVSVETFKKAAYKIQKPEGYNTAVLEELSAAVETGSPEEEGVLPDIILILNESWYDLTQVSDLTTDVEVMPYIHNMENTLQGYVVEPGAGNGTNLSEYEVLTGNSLQLMQGITPFNSLNMQGASSIVSALEEQGYQTAAFHPEVKDTYQRINAYPAMGFDQFYFIDDFDEWDYWENRTDYVTDESDYQNLLKIYNEYMDSDSPRFIYNLTTQNHGEYTLNNYRLSTVHVQEDFGDEWLGYRLNEYLSCVNLTDEAFWNLTQYFEDADHPVLICMVGDHAPSFVESVANKDLSDEEMTMKLHSTPYVIWANFDLSDVELPEYMGMPYIPSVLLNIAGATLTPYYDYMVNQLLPQVPVLTSYSHYRDADGEYHLYGDDTSCKDLLDTYFYMEYNTVKGGSGRKDKLFFLQ
jgi:multidrug transporter EmrE-like cation transporter